MGLYLAVILGEGSHFAGDLVSDGLRDRLAVDDRRHCRRRDVVEEQIEISQLQPPVSG